MSQAKEKRPDSRSSVNNDYDKAKNYWTQQLQVQHELMGVSDIGGCGLTEVLYRHFEEERHLRHLISFNRQQTILELGSGNGRWAIALAPLVKQYIAVDFSQQMLDIARSRVEHFKLSNVSFYCFAVQDYKLQLPLDIVYLSGISQYLQDIDMKKLLTRLKQFLRPDAVIIDRSTIHRRQRLMSAVPDYFYIYRTAEELKQLFCEAGFTLCYQQQSYRFLNVPGIVRRLLSARQVTSIIKRTTPLSFHFLRALAWISEHTWGHTGEVLDYSHDFFIFNRRTE